ncbi:NrfD/PsrC family molybdoenzyme membrane anchor subunit [Actinopolymorpha pittospori]|uniref:Formate-dependent nitrite reductase membrane component NrfD n=1 Tax=Actinopolymorpha pittospori TaxID=648752 RepID=A0A927RI26_9ACTN|nr:NrfD/PsrC family molybdoenzyme membrane anchor subunit [Actinopolymorpha pittospori]MBE1612840.1 formate-dependent nitrite reductase membrane component NrfD [Actinopolymorpha pittospori]
MKTREELQVPKAEFRSYYGRPILKQPHWRVPDVPLYLFLGGLAGASASMAALADLTGRPELARVGRLAAAGGASASVVALIHDLGRPTRFLNMLRVFKPTSPLSVGSWILAPFSAAATTAAASSVTGLLPQVGRVAGIGAGVLGPALSTYTAVLLADTAVPAWHEYYPELPFVFGGSALASAAGAALVAAPPAEQAPARKMAVLGAGLELAAMSRIERRGGVVGEPYRQGRPHQLLRAGRILTGVGAGLAVLGRRSRLTSAVAGTALLAGGLCTRFGVFYAGRASAADPRYVVLPQRERLAAQAAQAGQRGTADGTTPSSTP